MDSAATISHTPTVADLVSCAPDPRSWRGKPLSDSLWVVTDSEGEVGARADRAARTRMLLDPLAPTSMSTTGPDQNGGETTPISGGQRSAGSAAHSQQEDLPVVIVKQRTKLLAMKYATAMPTEELVARLEILNARVGRLMPRVDPVVQATLESDVARLRELSTEVDDLIASL